MQDVSNTHRDAIFSQASFPKRVWDLAVEVMDLFQQAKLKGQKLNLSTLLTKPEFKQQYFAPIRRLAEDEQSYLLRKVYKYMHSVSVWYFILLRFEFCYAVLSAYMVWMYMYM